MKKWTLLICALLISSGLLAWQFGLLSNNNKNLEFIPADTAYYLGGESTDNLAQFLSDYSATSLSPSQEKSLDSIVELFNNDEQSSQKSRFLSYFFSQYKKYNQSTISDISKYTGLSMVGSYALFSDGIIPVVRLDIANESVFNAVIEDAVKESQWQYQWDDLNGIKARVWPLTSKDVVIDVYLAIAVHQGTAIITLITNKDDLTAKQKRFGVIKPDESLADNGLIDGLKHRYGYTDDMLFFIQFDQIVKSVLFPLENQLGRNLQKYFKYSRQLEFQQDLSYECRYEFNRFAESIPRLVMGYQSLDINNDNLNYVYHSILELKNKSVVAELQNIQGHIPQHSTVVKDKIFTAAVAINVDNIVSSLEALKSEFINTEFECNQLELVQSVVESVNPNSYASIMSLALGVKGVGFSLFDISLDESNSNLISPDFLLTLSAENPTNVLNRIQNFPLLSNFDLSIPETGMHKKLDLPMFPKEIEVYASTQGKHIAVFSGPKSSNAITQLLTEENTSNGFLSLGLDYRKITDLLKDPVSNRILKQARQPISVCISKYEINQVLKSSAMDILFSSNISVNGLETSYIGSMNKPNKQLTTTDLAGKYNVQYLGEDCQWGGEDINEIKPDGTSKYTSFDNNHACEIYNSDETWTREGNKMQITSNEQTRERCDEPFSEVQTESYICHLINIDKDSFQCLYDPGTEYPSLAKYTRIAEQATQK